MKNHIISSLYLFLSFPVYLCVVIMYIYFSVMSILVRLIAKISKIDKICDWADSIDNFFSRIARSMF